jgi:flagellin
MSALTVNFNASAASATNDLTDTNNTLNTLIGQLSSGLQIQNASDNPAGYVSAGLLGDQAAGYGVDITNAQDGISMLQTAQGALNRVTIILQQMQQLAYSSANSGTTDSAAMAANQQEYAALSADLDQIAGSTKFGTSVLLNGSYSGTFQVGTGVSANSQLAISFDTGVSAGSLALTATNVSTQLDATKAITALSAAITTVDTIASQAGATQNELTDIVNNLSVGQENLQAAQAQIQDVNFAQASTQLAAQQVLLQSGSAMLANAQAEPSTLVRALGL